MIPNSVFQRFAQYDNKGKLDVKASVAYFEKEFRDWSDNRTDASAFILQLLADDRWQRLGESRLIELTLFQMGETSSQENKEMVKTTLENLKRANKIAYHQNEGGSRGRGAGWALVVSPKTEPPPAEEGPTRRPSRQMRAVSS